MSLEAGALLVSALSVLVAVAAVVVARNASDKADQIQERIAKVEEDRRRDELRPVIEVTFDRRNGPALYFRNKGPHDLDQVTIATVHKPPIVANYRFPDGTEAQDGDLGPLSLGAAFPLPVIEDKRYKGGLLALRVTTWAGPSSWDQAIDVDVSGYMRVWSA